MNNRTYDILKWIAQIVLPALGTLYFALASIWGFPYGDAVVGTITAIDAFLGALLGLSSSRYFKIDPDKVSPEKLAEIIDSALPKGISVKLDTHK